MSQKQKPARSDPYIRTYQMTQVLEPLWARTENDMLADLVRRADPLRLPELSVRLDFAHIAAAKPRHEVGPHLHAQMELFRVEQGSATFFVENRKTILRKGDVGIMPARTIHRWNNGKSPVVFLGFTLTAEPLTDDRNSLGYRLPAAAAALNYRMNPDRAITRALDALVEELRAGRPDSVHACASHLNVAMTLSFRQLRSALDCALPAESVPRTERYVLAAQAYIRAHLSEPMSIQNIADSIGISARHLNRMFRQAGLGSIGQSIEKSRIEHAQWLLSRSNYAVKTIAKLCGYCDAPYFSRAFKNHTGQLPSAVRNSGDAIITKS
jgi:AraC-like DNA-binding protein/mannose-6-phosphate isomerase-like protein (cupin superfamily)